MRSEEQFVEFMENAPVARITSSSGETVNLTGRQAREMGLSNYSIGTSAGAPIYKTDSGWSMKMEDAASSVKLDEKTGNVKIEAPKVFFETESYKTKVKPVLEAISQNYKLNPDYKYALLNGDKDTKTSKDWVNELQKDISNMVSGTLMNENVKKEILERDGVQLNDNQLIKMGSVALERNADGEVIKVKDDTIQSLPDRIRKLKAFQKLQGYDENAHAVAYKNLMESWNRENTSDDDIIQVFNEVDDYFRKRDFSDPDEYAEMVAFSQFINGKDPETGFWRGAWDGISNAVVGVITGAAEFDARVLEVIEGAFDVAGRAGTSLGRGMSTGKWEWADAPATGEANFVKDYLHPELEEWTKSFQTNSMRLNDAAGTTFAVTNALTPIAMQAAIGNALGKAAAAKIGNAASKLLVKTEGVASIAAETGMSVDDVATAALNGTNFLMRISTAENANRMIVDAVRTIKTFQSTTNAVMNMADLGAQIIVDVAVTDSKLFRQFLDGDSSPETKQYILQQAAQNAIGWGIGLGAVKAVKGVANSDLGRVVNATLTPKISKWKARIGGYVDTIKTNLLHGGDTDWNATKATRLRARLNAAPIEGGKRIRLENRIGAAERRQQNLTQRRLTRERADRVIGEMSGPFKDANSWTEVVENANRINRSVTNRITAVNLVANQVYNQDVTAEVSRIMRNNPTLQSATDDYIDSLQKVLSAEDASGIVRKTTAMDIGRGQVLSTMSEESNEYAYGLYRLRQAEMTKVEYTKIGKDLRGVQQEIDYYTKALADFQDTHSPELVEALNALEIKARKMSGATQTTRVAEGVMDQATLDARLNSGYFNDGYLRAQRVNEWENYQKRGGELNIGKLRDDQHIKWGFEGDRPDKFQDMSFVLFDDVNQVAKQTMRKEMIGYLQELGEKVDVLVSGDEVRIAKTINPILSDSVKNLERNATNIVKDLDGSEFNEIFDFKTAKSDIMTAGAKAMDSGAKVAGAKVRPIEISNRKLSNIIKDTNVFDDDTVAAIVDTKFGKSIADFTEKEWDDFISKASRNVKSNITRQMREIATLDTEYGSLTKGSLPKIRTSDFTRATGLKYKDADDWLKPFLSEKSGLPMDEVLSNIGDTNYDFLVNQDRIGNAWEQVEDIYNRVANRSTRVSLNYQDWENFLANGGNMRVDSINRAIVANNYDDIWDFDDKFVRTMVEDIERNKAVFEAETLYAENLKKLKDLKETYDLPQMAEDLRETADDIIDNLVINNIENKNVFKSLEALDDVDDVNDIAEYATLKTLTDKANFKEASQKIRRRAVKEFNEILTADNTVVKDGKTIKKLTGEQIKKAANQWADQTVEWIQDRAFQRYGEVVERLKAAGSDIIDYDDLYGKVAAINEEITGAAKADDVIKTYDSLGREEYVKLSPTVADMITTMPTPIRRSNFGELQQEFVRAFRAGTTGGLVPASLIRQGVRDPGNAFVGGLTMRNADVEDALTKVYGSTIADYYEKNVPDVWDTLLKQSQETGEDVNRLAVRQEMGLGAANVEGELESQLYRFQRQNRIARNQDGIYDRAVFDNARMKLEQFYDKTETLNNIRETGLRKSTYNNALLKALNDGHSLPNARRYAEFIQAEATTNFGRQAYHLANLTKTVPYLGSAINGSKSFWRLMALDPAGMTTRIIGGYVVPLIALTNISLGTEENARVYKQIPEYEKKDNLVFVLNGQKLSIPVPQEVSSFIRPVQSMIELMHGANDHSFAELTANNLVGFIPYNLEGFVNIDSDRILTDNVVDDVWQNHLAPGFAKLSSQMMPPIVKSGVMMATGFDPYTGKRVDTSYVTVDPETGESIVMDYKSGELAKMLGNIFGDFVSPQMAQAVLNNLLGTNNMAIIDGLSDIAASVQSEGGILSGFTGAAERLGESAMKPFVIPNYGEQSNLAWNRAVTELMREKEAILADKEYQADLKALSQGGLSQEAENKIKSRIETKRQEFQEKVLRASKNLVDEYGGTLDRNKYGSVISLMTWTSGQNQDPVSPLASQYDKEAHQLARAQGIETMVKMGFKSPNDSSLFGYYKLNKETGEIAVQYYSPLSVLNYETSSTLQDDVALANIKNVVNAEKLWDAHESIKEQIQKIYGSKTKLTNNDYANIEAIQINWNAQVAKTLAPYIAEMTPEAAINNTNVMNYLYSLIEVPSSWEVNDKGRYVSLGDRGNKKRAYYESWIKSMFSVNDPYKGQY
jgi:hypothetical protein